MTTASTGDSFGQITLPIDFSRNLKRVDDENHDEVKGVTLKDKPYIKKEAIY